MRTGNDIPAPAALVADPVQEQQLAQTWRAAGGVLGWLRQVDQRRIGTRYVITSLVFFTLAGVLALLMRVQLAQPQNDFLDPALYNALFTMHGTTMMFLFALPAMTGLGICIAPLMIGTRELSFPRLNAFGYYVYLIGGCVLFVALFAGHAPAIGWSGYAPLALQPYSGFGATIRALTLAFVAISALAAAVTLIVTILRQRAPGMSLQRMPLFVWAVLVMAFMIIVAMPPVITGSVMLVLERSFETAFFDVAGGGEPLLWQHLFWFSGQPAMHISLMPALGIVPAIIITFTRRPIFGYTALVPSLIAAGAISFGMWARHMVTTGMAHMPLSFFTAAGMMIAVPGAIHVICWIASLWGTRPVLATPMLYVLGFVAIFVIGGMSGIMGAAIPFATQAHDSYFLVAHLHYLAAGGALFPLLAAVYYWYPKLTGRMMNEGAGKWSCALVFIGFNLAFFPMHLLGLAGMPQRVYTYGHETDWGDLNLLVTIGAFVLAGGFLMTVINALVSYRRGAVAGPNPWNADTLEWATDSPPAPYVFRHIPVVEGRSPVWRHRARQLMPVVAGLHDARREVLVTSIGDAIPLAVSVLPGPSIWPFLTAVAAALGIIGFLFDPSWFVAGFFLCAVMLVGWLWPRRRWSEA